MSRIRTPARVVVLVLATGLLAPGAGLQAAPAAPPARTAPVADPSKPGGKAIALPLFRQGIALFDSGNYFEAIQRFKRAFFHFPSPKIHTRIALCYKWLRNNLKAVEHYELYLKATKPRTPADAAKMSVADKKLRADVSKTLVNLLKTISQLKVTLTKPAGAKLRINGRTVGKGPLSRTFRFNPGVVVVSVTAKDHTSFRQELKLVAGQTVALSVKLDRIKPDNRGGGAAADSL